VYCDHCGSQVSETAHYCPECGSAISRAAKPHLPASWWLIGLLAVLVIAALTAVVTAQVSGGHVAAKPVTTTTTLKVVSTTASTVQTTTTKVTPTTVSKTAVIARQKYLTFLQQIENVLQQSSRGRGQLSPLVSGVKNCTITPDIASQQIRTVIDNRTSVLSQLPALIATAPNPDATNIGSLLQQALQSSIDADTQYKGWMDYLYSQYYYTQPIGCPNGQAPENETFSMALVDDARSTNLKQTFSNAFDPIAAQFGLGTWSDSQF
jgi:zinc-ribbon domain